MTDEELRKTLDDYAEVGPAPDRLTAVGDLRRARRAPDRRRSRVSLVERDGLHVWEFGSMPAVASRGGLRRASHPMRAARSGKVVYERYLDPLGSNQIGEMLTAFDAKRNPAIDRAKGWKLRQWLGGKLVDAPAPTASPAPLLVVIHGTFSSGTEVFSEIDTAPFGTKFLSNAAAHYSAVLSFEHASVSMSPILNALDLATALEPYGNRPVDIICHSRGGLVASWWMHVVDRVPRPRRCVFVASPLQGTSLANPAKLRQSLNVMASYGKLLGDAAQATGFLALPFIILRVISSAVDLASRVPAIDAAFAMIPGLGAQSRVDNNGEIARLNANKRAASAEHFYIRSNFQPADVGWKIWKYVTDDPKMRIGNAIADLAVFPGANDLVVDCDAMVDPTGGQELMYEAKDSVHHTNYFRQQRTLDEIRKWYAIP